MTKWKIGLLEKAGYKDIILYWREFEKTSYGGIARRVTLDSTEVEVSETTIYKAINYEWGGDPLKRRGKSFSGGRKKKS